MECICKVKVSAVYDWPTTGLGPNLDLDLAGERSDLLFTTPADLLLGARLPMLCFDLLGPVFIDLVPGTWLTAELGPNLDLDLATSEDLLFTTPADLLLGARLPMLCFDLLGPVIVDLVPGT